MAWYSLFKWFIPWRKPPYQNMISWYKKFLYDEWFDSLLEEDKVKEEQRISALREKREQEGIDALEHLGQLYSMMDRACGGSMSDYMQAARDMSRITIHPSKYW